MKKRSGIQRAVNHATSDELRKMPTKALLARLARLRMCEDSLAVSDLHSADLESVNGILFKSSPEWSHAFTQVKEELASREHVPRPASKPHGRNTS